MRVPPGRHGEVTAVPLHSPTLKDMLCPQSISTSLTRIVLFTCVVLLRSLLALASMLVRAVINLGQSDDPSGSIKDNLDKYFLR